MLVANSFDLWQKDTFFSAAEEVQDSADVMESTYRRWVRERKERSSLENLDELSRDLQTTLGTAKWQLEEFERAVGLSYGHRPEDKVTTRHSQFITAIESQISRVETDLREYLREEGKKSLRWVNLDEEERYDLAAFLSGTSLVTHTIRDEKELQSPAKISSTENHMNQRDRSPQSSSSSRRVTYDDKVYFKEGINANNNENQAMEEDRREDSGSREDINFHGDKRANARRIRSTQNLDELRIVVSEDDEERNKSMLEFEGTPKEKGSKFGLLKKRCREFSRANGAVYLFNQVFFRVSGSQRHNPPRMHFGRSIQVTLVLTLTIFLIVPFLMFSY